MRLVPPGYLKVCFGLSERLSSSEQSLCANTSVSRVTETIFFRFGIFTCCDFPPCCGACISLMSQNDNAFRTIRYEYVNTSM